MLYKILEKKNRTSLQFHPSPHPQTWRYILYITFWKFPKYRPHYYKQTFRALPSISVLSLPDEDRNTQLSHGGLLPTQSEILHSWDARNNCHPATNSCVTSISPSLPPSTSLHSLLSLSHKVDKGKTVSHPGFCPLAPQSMLSKAQSRQNTRWHLRV